MRIFTVFILVLGMMVCTVLNKKAIAGRQKRGVIQLSQLFKQFFGENAIDFLGYGSYCGWNGYGDPVDCIDNCCLEHDTCFGVLQTESVCIGLEVYTVNYNYDVTSRTITCSDSVDTCAVGLCACDKLLIECLNFFKDIYNPDNYKLIRGILPFPKAPPGPTKKLPIIPDCNSGN